MVFLGLGSLVDLVPLSFVLLFFFLLSSPSCFPGWMNAGILRGEFMGFCPFYTSFPLCLTGAVPGTRLVACRMQDALYVDVVGWCDWPDGVCVAECWGVAVLGCNDMGYG